MFDIGFWEIALIGVIALLVIGPEKLPGVARNVGAWVGKGKRLVGSVQADINRELNRAEELKKLLEEQKNIVKNSDIVKELQKTIPVSGQLSGANANTTSGPGSGDTKQIENKTKQTSTATAADTTKTRTTKKTVKKTAAAKKIINKKLVVKKKAGTTVSKKRSSKKT